MNKKIQEIVNYAYKNVQYYRDRSDSVNGVLTEKEWQNIPILTKNEVVMNQDSLISNPSIIKYINNQLRIEHTSGSTGKCLEVLWEEGDYQRSLLPLYIRRIKYHGIHPDDKLCFFYTVRSKEKEDVEFVEKNQTLAFSKSNLNAKKMLEIYDKMKRFEPAWILGQPSVLLLLADTIVENRLEPIFSIKYIELTGEMLFPATRKRIEDVFKCQIANHYGTIEVSSIAYECPCGNLHLTDSTYTEIIDSEGNVQRDGKEGEVCVTSLVNKAMPLIRYNIGDKAIISSGNECKCGSSNKILKLTTGRINDYISTRTGERVNSYIFVRAIEIVNHIFPQAIKQFQIVQDDYLHFSIIFAIDNDYNSKDISELFVRSVWQNELKQAIYHFEFVHELFPSDNGKLSYFMNNIKN